MLKLTQRPRRLRRSQSVRNLVQETNLHSSDFVWPVFIEQGKNSIKEISSMPNVFRYSLDQLFKALEQPLKDGLQAIALFPSIIDSLKSKNAAESYNPKGFLPETVSALKKEFPHLTLFTDVALDPYSSDGHDGLVKNSEILNDETVKVLCLQAETQAAAGADFVAASDMMDGRIGAIRQHLDARGFTQTGILSYSAKYASSFYGPFREALDSAPRSGDKKTYQMNPANRREALREGTLDTQEGADILMVKPALSYLDVISEFKKNFKVPIAAYQVSGEYAMIAHSAKAGFLNEEQAMLETLTSIKRAGSDITFTYFAPKILKYLQA